MWQYLINMKTYTLGFIFDSTMSKVLLIHKQRPDWQKGKLNGIGGKIEPGEESVACLVREVLEETGIKTNKNAWMYFNRIQGPEYWVDCYAVIHAGKLSAASTMTDEVIDWFDAKNIPIHAISNLRWLIPLAVDKLEHNKFHYSSVHYKE